MNKMTALQKSFPVIQSRQSITAFITLDTKQAEFTGERGKRRSFYSARFTNTRTNLNGKD